MDIGKIRAKLIERGFTEPEIADRLRPIEVVARARVQVAERHRQTQLTDKVIEEAQCFLEEALGIRPDRNQILETIPPGSETYGIMCEYGVAGDTATRDEVADCFARRFMCRAIPRYGDNWSDEQTRRFYDELAEAAHAAGIRVPNKQN